MESAQIIILYELETSQRSEEPWPVEVILIGDHVAFFKSRSNMPLAVDPACLGHSIYTSRF